MEDGVERHVISRKSPKLLNPMKTQFKCIIAGICRSLAGGTRLAILLTVPWLAMPAGATVVAPGFNSGVIGFDYSFPEIGYAAYGPGPGAIGSAGDLWNSVSTIYYGGTQKGPLSLFNTDGAATSVQWYVTGGGGLSGADGGTYGRLFDVSTYIASANISGLTPNQSYNLYLYSVYWDEQMSVNGVNFTMPGVRGSVDTLTVGSDYDVHTVTADSSGTLTFVTVYAQFGTPYISSWQLTPAPEPPVLGLLAAGTAALLVRRRRN
jgi:hypothetical protein